MGFHDPGYSLPSDVLPCFTKIQEYPRAPVDPAAGRLRLADQLKEAFVFDRTVRERPVDPSIETARSDLQDPAHCPNWKSGALRVDEGVLYSDSLAKYAAAFFRMSRSS
jgi:hypothetical protein